MKNKIGWISAFLIVLGYFLMTINVINSESLYYNLINLIGGAGLAYRVWLDKIYSNLVLEIIFVLVAILNLIIIFSKM